MVHISQLNEVDALAAAEQTGYKFSQVLPTRYGFVLYTASGRQRFVFVVRNVHPSLVRFGFADMPTEGIWRVVDYLRKKYLFDMVNYPVTYLHHSGGLYNIIHRSPAPAAAGLPAPDGANIINLSWVGGNTDAPPALVVYEHDLSSFSKVTKPPQPAGADAPEQQDVNIADGDSQSSQFIL